MEQILFTVPPTPHKLEKEMTKISELIQETVNKLVANKFAETIWEPYNVQNNFQMISSGGKVSVDSEHWVVFLDKQQNRYVGYKVTGINPKDVTHEPEIADGAAVQDVVKKLKVKPTKKIETDESSEWAQKQRARKRRFAMVNQY